MKNLIALLAAIALSSAAAADQFEDACKSIDARITESSSITCRYFGKSMNASFHRDADGDVYAAMFVDGPRITEEAVQMLPRLAKAMGVTLLPQFIESVKSGGAGIRTGMQYQDKLIIWRNALSSGPINYSGFAIYKKDDGKNLQPARCFPAGCIVESIQKWFGPAYESGKQNISN